MGIISRHQAITLNLKRFYSGQPCKHGHNCERYTLNGGCVDCVNPKFEWAGKAMRYPGMYEMRMAAAAAGQSRYNVGLPCKHGHNCERYVSTNGCVECLSPSRNAEAKAAIVAAKSQMVRWGFALHYADLEAFTLTAHLYAVARCSAIAVKDVVSKRRPDGSGIPDFKTHFFYINEGDREPLLGMERALKVARGVKVAPICNHEWEPYLDGEREICKLCRHFKYQRVK